MDRLASYFLTGVLTLGLVACNSPDGSVVDESGAPLQGIKVLAANSHGTTYMTESDESGQFSFDSFEGKFTYIGTRTPDYLDQTFTAARFSSLGNQVVLTIDDQPSDMDRDGLSDGEEVLHGTSYYVPDTDSDSLSDSAEVLLSDGFSPVALGVEPGRRDILLEVDWSVHAPKSKITPLAVLIMQHSFRNAPISNPDGSEGINLIVDDGRFGGGTAIDIAAQWDFWDSPYAEEQLAPERRPYFYHSLAVESIEGLYGFGYYYARLNVITGDFSFLGPLEGVAEAMLLQHELGHNLYLRHGGDDDIVCKPNYPSVMNYNPFLGLSFTYSTGDMPTLNENALNEVTGVGLGPVDWNMNFLIEEQLVSADVNSLVPVNIVQHIAAILALDELPVLGGLFGEGRCGEPVAETLRDHDDWSRIEANLGRYLVLPSEMSSFSQRAGVPSERIEDTYFPLEALNYLLDSDITEEEIREMVEE